MGPLYFVEGMTESAEIEATIERLGLSYAFVSGFSPNPITHGPSGKPGCVLAAGVEAHGAEAPFGAYVPDTQEWHEAPGKGFWVGWDNSRPPRPVDLQRREILEGRNVKMGDGQLWHVPTARLWPTGESAFEQRMILQADGTWAKKPLDKYAKLCEIAERLDAIREKETVEFDESDAVSMAVNILAVNYRVGPVEAHVLGLLTTTEGGTVVRLFNVFMGFPQLGEMLAAMEEASKKNDPAGILAGSGL